VKQDITTESKALKKVKRELYFSLLMMFAFMLISTAILFNVLGFQGLFVGLLGLLGSGTFIFLGLQAFWREPTVPKHEGFLPAPSRPLGQRGSSVLVSVWSQLFCLASLNPTCPT
jgi:Ca2+/Na+ antiporter